MLQFRQFSPRAGHLADQLLLPDALWDWLPQQGHGRKDRFA